jgi:hypothetical protein
MTGTNPKGKKIFILGLFIILIISLALIFNTALNVGTASADADPPQGDTSTLSGDGLSADVWQAVWVSQEQGDPYWATAPKPVKLLDISGSQSGSGDDFSKVSTLENSVWMKLSSSVDSWAFTAKETITITNADGETVKTVSNQAPLEINGDNAQPNQNIQITGSWITGDQLEDILSLPNGQYHFVVTLSDINLQADGSNLSASSITDENTLSWLIKIG